MFDSGLYEQRQSYVHKMGERAYMAAIAVFTALFIIVSMLGASFSYGWTFSSGLLLLVFMVACVAASIGGAVLAHSNEDPMTSVIGGGICAFAIGVMCGPVIAQFTTGSVVQAFVLAAGVVVITGIIGAILPYDLSAWGAPLFGLLIGAIFIQFGGIILSMFGFDMNLTFTVLDWAVLALFCFIMIYDLNRARQIDRNLDNAVDVAVSVFLNFANIFLRILSLLGQSRD